MKIISALRGIFHNTFNSNPNRQESKAMKNATSTSILGGAFVALSLTTLTACSDDLPGAAFKRDDLTVTVQFPAVCETEGAPAFCDAPYVIGLQAEMGDVDQDGVDDPYMGNATLNRSGLTAETTVADVPTSDQQVIPLDITYPPLPEGWKVEHVSGNNAPDPFMFYPNIEEGDATSEWDKALNLRIVASNGGGTTGQCSFNADCGPDQVCQDGTCHGGVGEGGGCSMTLDCLPGLECEGGVCTDPTCNSNMDCQDGQACINDACQDVPCTMDAHCAEHEECDEQTYECVPDGTCSANSDCPNGQSCNLDTKMCEADDGTCNSNADCPNGQVCDQVTDMCVPGECSSNEDCEVDEVCNLDTKTCEGIEQGDFCTRPLWDTGTPDVYGNQMLVFGTNLTSIDVEVYVGVEYEDGDQTLMCGELTDAQKASVMIDLTDGPIHKGQALCSENNNVIDCNPNLLAVNATACGEVLIGGNFGKALMPLCVQNKDVAYKPAEPELSEAGI